MFRYVFVLLLINIYYCSLGLPIESNSVTNLSKFLTALASNCDNKFLTNEILSMTTDCNFSAPPYSEKQLQCLIFYDMNSQLCAVASKLSSSENYTTKINEPREVNSMCNIARDWVFSNLTEFSQYKLTIERVFKSPILCGKVCGVEELMIDDSNYYCKYYKWGLDLLKNQTNVVTSSVVDNNSVIVPVIESFPKIDIKNEVSSPINMNQTDQQNKNSMTSNEHPKLTESTSDKSTTAKHDVPIKNDVEKQETSSNKQLPNPDLISEPEKNDDTDLNVNKIEDPSDGLEENLSSNSLQVAKSPEEEKSKKLDVGILENTGNKPPSDTDDFDSDDGKMGEDDEDPGLGDKLDQEAIMNFDKKIEPIVSQRGDMYANTGSQEGFPEDDDHFFSFFLTAVVLVVLLYILYHNKNKVVKVFLGLVLEGRQSGRRRNSRGHAYRRLDTLEQAMSSKTDAPPSKIIY